MTDRVAGGEARRRPGGLVPAASAGPRGPGRRKRTRCGRAATPARLRRGCGRGRAARRSRRPAGVRGGAFADARNILGAGEARNRTRRAVERIVPFALIVSTLVITWYARHGHPRHAVTARRHDQPWYHAKTARLRGHAHPAAPHHDRRPHFRGFQRTPNPRANPASAGSLRVPGSLVTACLNYAGG